CRTPWLKRKVTFGMPAGVGGRGHSEEARPTGKVEWANRMNAPISPGPLRSTPSRLAVGHGFGACGWAHAPVGGHVPVPLVILVTLMEDCPAFPVSFPAPAISPMTCTDSPTCEESAATLALGGKFNL